MIKYVKSQKTGEYVPITKGDMDFNTKFANNILVIKAIPAAEIMTNAVFFELRIP